LQGPEEDNLLCAVTVGERVTRVRRTTVNAVRIDKHCVMQPMLELGAGGGRSLDL
jgi:hypothetical protein